MENSLKHAACCNRNIDCIDCSQSDLCAKWQFYVSKHSTPKGYAHFDKRTSLADYRTRHKVLNPKWVAHHGFWPLIYCEIPKRKFSSHKGRKATPVNKRPREIRYCSHIDRCIYQRYSFLLDYLYNDYVAKCGIDDSAIAYRTNKEKCNIDYAKQAIDFIRSSQQCIIYVADFTNFFDLIDHDILKREFCNLLNVKSLPQDFYAVFKNATKYSSWNWKSFLKICNLEQCHKARKELNSRETILTPGQFRENAKKCISANLNGFGIPQGSPISAVFSNIYMLHFDQDVKSIADLHHGLYLRYCDDLLLVIPVVNGDLPTSIAAVEQVRECVTSQKGVEIQPDKTRLLRYDSRDANPLCEINELGDAIAEKSQLDYLGFSFDGNSAKVRAKAISKYHYRMRRKAKNIAASGQGSKNLYGTYSKHSHKISGKGSFVDYLERASRKMSLDDPESNAIISHNLEKIAKTLNSQKQSIS